MKLSQVILNMALKVSYDIPLSKWRRKIGYAMQSNSMMSGTIRTIFYTRKLIAMFQMKNLLIMPELANCHGFYHAI